MAAPGIGADAEPRVGVALPAYREGARLSRFLASLVDAGVARRTPAVDWVVVDDGSGGAHAEAARAAAGAQSARLRAAGAAHSVSFLPVPRNRGKGAAIRLAWEGLAPRCAWLGFLDADGAAGAREFWRLAAMLEGDPAFDVLAASRARAAGGWVERSVLRRVQGRVFAALVESLLRLGLLDTQCGLKFFRAALARRWLPLLREERWLLDVELLSLARAESARVVEEPIDWADVGESKLVPGLDAARMAYGLLRLRMRALAARGAR